MMFTNVLNELWDQLIENIMIVKRFVFTIFERSYLLVLVAASLLATCSRILPCRMFLKTEIDSEWDRPWRGIPFTAKISSPEKKHENY